MILLGSIVLLTIAGLIVSRQLRGTTPSTAVQSGSVIRDAEETVVAQTPGTASAPTVRPTVSENAAAAPAVATTGTATTSPSGSSAPTGSARFEDFRTKAAACAKLEVAKDWPGLRDCAGELAKVGSTDKASKDKAEAFWANADKEIAAEAAASRMQDALRDGNLREAQKQLKTVGSDSVYWTAMNDGFKAAEARAVEDNRRKALGLAQARDCAALRRLQTQLTATSTVAVSGAVAQVTLKCVEKQPQTAGTDSGSKATSTKPQPTTPQPPQPKNPCDTMNVDDVMSQAAGQYAAGFGKAALQLLTKALACKQNDRMYRMAAMYACAAHEASDAKLYYAKVSPGFHAAIIQRCDNEGIAIP
jgi:hypothetical protein